MKIKKTNEKIPTFQQANLTLILSHILVNWINQCFFFFFQECVKNPRLKDQKRGSWIRGNINSTIFWQKPKQELPRIVEGLGQIRGKEQMKGEISCIKAGKESQKQPDYLTAFPAVCLLSKSITLKTLAYSNHQDYNTVFIYYLLCLSS